MRMGATVARQTEDDLWQHQVEALRRGIEIRDPDAIAQAKEHVRKLEGEISAIAIRRQVVAKANTHGAMTSIEIVMDANLARLNGRMTELRELLRKVRPGQRQTGEHGTPQLAVRPSETILWGMPDGLKASAEDLHNGWAVMYGKSQARASNYAPTIPGQDDIGRMGQVLLDQYHGWAAEMGRIRLGVWPVTDVICEGRGYLESAKLRKSLPEVVRLMVQSGLTLYHGMYPPIDRPSEKA